MTRKEAIMILKDCELNPCVPKDKEAADMAIKALEIVEDVKQIIDEWNDKITEPEEDIYYLCNIARLFEQKGE